MKKVFCSLFFLVLSALPGHLLAIEYFCDQNSIGASVFRCEAQETFENYIDRELKPVELLIFPTQQAARSCARQCRRSKTCREAKTSYKKKICRRDCRKSCFAGRSENVSRAYANVVADYQAECSLSMSKSQCQAKDSEKYCNMKLAENGLRQYPTTSVRKFKRLKRITRRVGRSIRMRLNDLVSASLQVADEVRVSVNKRVNEKFPGCNPIPGNYYPCEDKSAFWRALNPSFNLSYFNLVKANDIEVNHSSICKEAGDGGHVQPTPTPTPTPIGQVLPTPTPTPAPAAATGRCSTSTSSSTTDDDGDGNPESRGPDGYVCCNSTSVTDDVRYCCYSKTTSHSYCL